MATIELLHDFPLEHKPHNLFSKYFVLTVFCWSPAHNVPDGCSWIFPPSFYHGIWESRIYLEDNVFGDVFLLATEISSLLSFNRVLAHRKSKLRYVARILRYLRTSRKLPSSFSLCLVGIWVSNEIQALWNILSRKTSLTTQKWIFFSSIVSETIRRCVWKFH